MPIQPYASFRRRGRPRRPAVLAKAAWAIVLVAGCTGPRAWIANGFKVGPEYCPPAVRIAEDWIDSDDQRVLDEPVDHVAWWAQFNDPMLNELVAEAYGQNLTLREAGSRIYEARMLRAIAAGDVAPQAQSLSGGYSYNQAVGAGPGRRFSLWNGSFSYAWELDFWGRYRRAVAAADADLDAAVFDYGDVVVTLVADVAATYIDIRTLQSRLELVKRNVENQRKTFELTETRFTGELASQIDVQQAKSSLAQTEAFVPQLEIALRQAQNQLCLLLGIPPEDLSQRLGDGGIPTVSRNVAVGIPAASLLRRPDVRRAERELAAQSELIGIAESDLYPHITLSGDVGVSARRIDDLFKGSAEFASVGPSFRWDILNYGRIAAGVGVQEARFQQLLARYRQAVLVANLEAENAINRFLKSQVRLEFQLQAAEAAGATNELINFSLEEGQVDFNRVFNVQNFKTQQEESAAVAKGDVAQNLISIYRALGGGWPSPYLRQGVILGASPVEGGEAERADPAAEELPLPDVSLRLPDSVAPGP
jgi:NodT family efflux transporter outer membrane factor (OMF) lipoprotein